LSDLRRREFITLIGGAAAAWPLAAWAQHAALPVIGFLHSRGPEDAAHIAAGFRRGLRDAGFIDGQNVRIEYRWARGQYDQLSALAKGLAGIPVSIIVAGGGTPAVLAAKSATTTIPIVFVMSGDAVELGLAKSINRPGENATGIDIFATVLDPKRLSILHDLVPGADTIGYLVNASFPPSVQQVSSVEAAARAMSLRIRVLRASNEREIDAALETLGTENIRALAVASSPYFDTQRNRIVQLAARRSVPAIYHFREYAVAGGLASYGVDIVDAYRQVALYAAQILKGAKPGDLPILQAAKFDLVINLKTAKALGLTIPPGVLAIADEVIE
jgi:putative ABC transport system substrate-binding protein